MPAGPAIYFVDRICHTIMICRQEALHDLSKEKARKHKSGQHYRKDENMKHIVTLDTRDMAKSAVNGGCGECQTSCQSACKTSCGVANQPCENKEAE